VSDYKPHKTAGCCNQCSRFGGWIATLEGDRRQWLYGWYMRHRQLATQPLQGCAHFDQAVPVRTRPLVWSREPGMRWCLSLAVGSWGRSPLIPIHSANESSSAHTWATSAGERVTANFSAETISPLKPLVTFPSIQSGFLSKSLNTRSVLKVRRWLQST